MYDECRLKKPDTRPMRAEIMLDENAQQRIHLKFNAKFATESSFADVHRDSVMYPTACF